MTKITKLLLILITFFILINNGCKKDKTVKCEKHNTLFLPQELKDRFFFKDSSFWIYKDSINGQLDSCWVSSSFIGVSDPKFTEKISPTSKGKCFEDASYFINSNIQVKQEMFLNSDLSSIGTKLEDEFFLLKLNKKL